MLYCAGAMFSYLLGWFSRYHAIVWVNLATSVLGVVLMGTVGESPVFLLKKNREEVSFEGRYRYLVDIRLYRPNDLLAA